MDLLAPILTYLGTVTAIIVAAVMSYDAFVYTPLHSIDAPHTLMVEAKPNAAKAALSASANKNKIALARAPIAAVSHGVPEVTAAPQVGITAERRAAYLRKEARQKRMRRLARRPGAGEWVAQQLPGPVGYANEPPEGLYNAFPYQ